VRTNSSNEAREALEGAGFEVVKIEGKFKGGSRAMKKTTIVQIEALLAAVALLAGCRTAQQTHIRNSMATGLYNPSTGESTTCNESALPLGGISGVLAGMGNVRWCVKARQERGFVEESQLRPPAGASVDADQAACHQDSGSSFSESFLAGYSEAVRERIALGQAQEIKCLLGRGWSVAPPEVTNTLSGR